MAQSRSGSKLLACLLSKVWWTEPLRTDSTALTKPIFAEAQTRMMSDYRMKKRRSCACEAILARVGAAFEASESRYENRSPRTL
jgi:hypothetical protein